MARVLLTCKIAYLVKSSEAGLAIVTGVVPVSASSIPYIADMFGMKATVDLDCAPAFSYSNCAYSAASASVACCESSLLDKTAAKFGKSLTVSPVIVFALIFL